MLPYYRLVTQRFMDRIAQGHHRPNATPSSYRGWAAELATAG
jgi:hypothetical protein